MTTDPSPLPGKLRGNAGSVVPLPFGTRFEQLDRILVEAGFASVETLSFGEEGPPDRACWTLGEQEVRYIRDPATGLATIVAPEGVALPFTEMVPDEALELIAAPDPRRALAGLQAAAILKAPALALAVAGRLLDPDPVVAEHAAGALRALAGAIAPAGLADLGGALFALPGWRREKLQVMRWLGHEGSAAGEAEGLLARALGDADWEIRVTAMLAAARLGLAPLALPIAAIALPDRPADGVTSRESRLLRALRDAALARLGELVDRPLPPGVEAAVGGDVAGLPPGLAAFAFALSHPLPDEIPPPPDTPAVAWAAEGPRLADGHLLAWVPPVPHWLGEAELRGAALNPPRRAAPSAGFFIDAEPRGAGTFAEALAAAAALARTLGRAVSLPSAEAWEMAARGPDGRRFPWGMNARPEARVDLSPWGMAGIASGASEWVGAGTAAEPALAAGGEQNPVAARFVERDSNQPLNFRFYYPAA